VTSSNGERAPANRPLQATPNCLPIERFGETWTPEESAHVTTCARCQTELALWKEFETSTTAPTERDDVQRITTALRTRFAAPPAPARAWRWLTVPRFAAAAATIALAALIGYSVWDPEPKLRLIRHDDGEVYRTIHVQLLAPMGDVEVAPRTLRWTRFDGASGYDVRLMEVDGTVVWRGSSESPAVDLPADVVARIVPGKTLVWEVAARNAAGSVVAQSGAQRFRVAPSPAPLRDR
jgi:hypothetical protein